MLIQACRSGSTREGTRSDRSTSPGSTLRRRRRRRPSLSKSVIYLPPCQEMCSKSALTSGGGNSGDARWASTDASLCHDQVTPPEAEIATRARSRRSHTGRASAAGRDVHHRQRGRTMPASAGWPHLIAARERRGDRVLTLRWGPGRRRCRRALQRHGRRLSDR
jgi:hypothetical protein